MVTIAMRAATGWFAITRYLPSNLLIAWLRARPMLRWAALIAVSFAVGYFAAAIALAWLVADQGAPGWVGIFSLVALVSAVKFAVYAPVSLVLRARAKWAERRFTHA